MPEQPAYRPVPAHPPSGSRDPEWTTGQGIGFLVALPGWLLLGLSMLVALVGLAVSDSTDAGPEIFISGVIIAVFGMIIAIPGTIVFNKCKRRR